jgi:hypothetical protein
MNKKILFLLPFFLLFPAATQCMEKEIVFIPKTMQEIRDERNEIYEKILIHEQNMQLNSKYRKNNYLLHNDAMFIVFQDKSLPYKDVPCHRPYLQKLCFEKCSCLTLAIIAIERPKFVADYDKWGQMCNYNLMQNPKQAPFKEKKEAVQAFLKIELQPTSKDRYFALLTKCDEFVPTIIKKILLLRDILLLSEIEVPQEAIRDIPLLMFNAEESLL